jgi:prepilin-type N-terminal cleavage/methylation domain-containing protein
VLGRLRKNDRGFTLIEVLIAMLIMSVFAVTFLAGLAASSRAVMVADERTTAESLARSQMEFVKIDAYKAVTDPTQTGSYEMIPLSEMDIASGYSIWSLGRGGTEVEGVVGVPWYEYTDSEWTSSSPADMGIQKVTLIIKHGERTVLTLEDYKANR